MVTPPELVAADPGLYASRCAGSAEPIIYRQSIKGATGPEPGPNGTSRLVGGKWTATAKFDSTSLIDLDFSITAPEGGFVRFFISSSGRDKPLGTGIFESSMPEAGGPYRLSYTGANPYPPLCDPLSLRAVIHALSYVSGTGSRAINRMSASFEMTCKDAPTVQGCIHYQR